MTISFTLSVSPEPASSAPRAQPVRIELAGTGSQKLQERAAPQTRPAEEARPAADRDGALAREGDEMRELVERANEKLRSSSAVISFNVDPDTKMVVTTLLDSRTNEVIRQIPNEAVLEIARSLDKIASVLVQEKL